MILSRSALLAVLALGPVALAQDGIGEPPKAQKERGLAFEAPAAWRAVEPTEPERAAWSARPERSPRVRVALVRHRKKKPLDEHVARWTRASVDADGEPLAPTAVEREPIVLAGLDGLSATLIALRGTHVAPVEPGAEEVPRHEGWAALHAVIEGPDGTWVASVVGPAASVDAVKAGLVALVKSVRVGLIEAEPEPEDAPVPPGGARD